MRRQKLTAQAVHSRTSFYFCPFPTLALNRNVTILGVCLVGSLLAILLRRRGYPVTIYERRPDMRRATIGAA